MKYENIKSAILSVLVVISVVLTWNLWTYQPKYETKENSKLVQEIALSEKREMTDIIKPNKILYHFTDAHFGTTFREDIDRILQEMEIWNFYNIKDISAEVDHLPSFLHSKGKVELVFPELVPIEVYKKIIKTDDNKIPNILFNRIVIDVESRLEGDGKVYFVYDGDEGNHYVYEGTIKTSDMVNFYNQFYSTSTRLKPYMSYNVSGNRTLFLPKNTTEMVSYKYFLDILDTEKFKDALFSDPSYVQRNIISNNVEYTDGSSMLTVHHDLLLLSYVNPAEESNISGSPADLLQKSIDFINGHGGWTGTYQYDGLDEVNHKVIFRLYDHEGYPIFNKKGLTEIVQIWGQKEIHKYVRPIFDLNMPLRIETTEVAFSSAIEALDYLKTNRRIKLENLEDLVIGYYMSKDEDHPQLINIEPSWFYKYGGSWLQITPEELGGTSNGLE